MSTSAWDKAANRVALCGMLLNAVLAAFAGLVLVYLLS